MTKGERISQSFKIGELHDKIRGSIKILKHTSRGSKLRNLYVAFECASQMFACICISFRSFLSDTLLVWCMLVVGLIDEMKN